MTEELMAKYSDASGRLWVKNVKIRNSGVSWGRSDVYIINPDGDKLRSIKELTVYISTTGYFDIDPTEVNFEKKTAPKVFHKHTLGTAYGNPNYCLKLTRCLSL